MGAQVERTAETVDAPESDGSRRSVSGITTVGHMAQPPEEPELVADPERVRQLLEEHFALVWRTAVRLGIPADRADDVAQEVFMVAARKLEQIREGRERSFVLGVTVRVCSNWRRARHARPEVFEEDMIQRHEDPTPGPDMLLEQKRLRALLDEALDTLPEHNRTVFVLVEIEGLSCPEVGAALELPLGTVASRLRRARAQFHDAAHRLRARRHGAADRNTEGQ
jgi:RNA polymerase sigma-70 factor (ECF subfamily)